MAETLGGGFEFNVKLVHFLDNTYGAKIFKDPVNQYVVKIEDHIFEFEASQFVNYQGDCYMGKDKVMYLVVENPMIVDVLGHEVNLDPNEVKEAPPT